MGAIFLEIIGPEKPGRSLLLHGDIVGAPAAHQGMHEVLNTILKSALTNILTTGVYLPLSNCRSHIYPVKFNAAWICASAITSAYFACKSKRLALCGAACLSPQASATKMGMKPF